MCGVLHLEVNVEGKACHAMDPDKGINAIQKMAKVISRIEQHYQVLRQRQSSIPGILSSTASVGTIKGGVKTNVVPDFCSITIDRRIVPGETGEKAKEELVAIFNDLMKQDPDLKLKWNEVMVADPYVSDQNSILIQILKKNSKQILGTDLPVEGLGGFSDGRFFANDMGIPTAHYGPGQIVEGRPHGVNENVRIDDLVKVAKVCALTIMDLLG